MTVDVPPERCLAGRRPATISGQAKVVTDPALAMTDSGAHHAGHADCQDSISKRGVRSRCAPNQKISPVG
jgi:hypothetical protein